MEYTAIMVLHKTILILEDDLKTLSLILDRLAELEGDQPYDLSTIVLTNHLQVQKLVNESIGTTELGLPFALISDPAPSKSNLVPPAG